MKYALKYHDEAKKELIKELAYSRKNWGLKHSIKYAQELKSKIESLRENPFLNPEKAEILKGLRLVTYKGSQIAYVIDLSKSRVFILAVISIYQNLPEDLDKRAFDA